MPIAHAGPIKPILFGRSSSHFTRVTRIFAAELEVDYAFEVVRDLMSTDAVDYGGNPALTLPALRSSRGTWFGALNICRELSRLSTRDPRIVWPEHLDEPSLANAQELVLQAMATEVTLVLSGLGRGDEGSAHQAKLRRRLTNIMDWLEGNAARVLDGLPAERDLSFLEVTLFCLVDHLEFREVMSVAPYAELNGFRRRFSTRASAQATPYRFDP